MIPQRQKVSASTLEAQRDRSTSNRHLPLLITVSILIHEGLLLVFMGNPWLLSKAAPSGADQIPIEFVELDPQQSAQDPPPDTNNVALQNSQAQADLSSESNLDSTDAPQQTGQSSFQALQDTPQRFEETAEYARAQVRPDQPSPIRSSRPTPTQKTTQATNTAQQKSEAEAALDLPPLDPNGLVAGVANSEPVLARATPLPPGSRSASTLGGGQVGINPQNSSLYSVKNDRSGTGQGADARQDVDLGPYLARLKANVEGAWNPVNDSPYSQVVLHFSILKNGTLSNLNVARSSLEPAIDQAALNAVRTASAAFEPLPEGYHREALHIEFTFTVRAGSANISH